MYRVGLLAEVLSVWAGADVGSVSVAIVMSTSAMVDKSRVGCWCEEEIRPLHRPPI